jgi:hypothetical protein
MSNIFQPTDMALLPEEDIGPMSVEQQRAALEAGAISRAQPGLAPEALEPTQTGGGGGGGGGGTGGGGTGGGGTGGGGGGGGGAKTVISTDQFVRGGRNILRTTYSDGTYTDEDLGPEKVEPTTGATTFTPARDARNTIRTVLQTYGLGNLSDFLYERYAREEVNIANPDAILFALRDTDEYKTRFAANARRAAKGLPELDPGSYIGLENQYRDMLRSNGLPLGFYDQTSDFEKLIENDVSPSELQSRVSNGYRMVADADPAVKQQMRELYNVDEAGLAAYFLDPDRAAPLLEKQARAAKIAARSRQQAGLQIGAAIAEDLISRGYTAEEAQSAFEKAGQLAGLYQEMGGEQALTTEQKVGAALGFDVQAQQALEQRQRTRLAEFQGGGGFARTSGATSGTVETGAGTAQ